MRLIPYIGGMKQILLATALAFSVTPALAQGEDAPLDDGAEIEDGFNLMEEGARLMFRGLMNELEPALDDFEEMARDLEPRFEMLADEMGPALMELFQTLDSVRYYDAPEILPNGDIIIRRSPDAPEYAPRSIPDGPAGDGEAEEPIDL